MRHFLRHFSGIRVPAIVMLTTVLAGAVVKPNPSLADNQTVASDQGVISIESAHSVATTGDRFEAILAEKGLTQFARIDHAAGAESVDLELRPTQLIIFGNPKVGTPLMQCNQQTAIDLPQKALIWEDEAGQVWMSYNDPQYLGQRHTLDACAEVLGRIEMVLANLVNAATQP